MAAQVFNPLVVADMCLYQMVDAPKDLYFFGFDGSPLGYGTIGNVNNGLSSYRAIINSTPKSFWFEVEGVDDYDASLKKKAEKDPKKYGDSMWEDDALLEIHVVCGVVVCKSCQVQLLLHIILPYLDLYMLVDSAKYLGSAPMAKYVNIWIWLWRLCVDLASADYGFGFVG